MSEKLEAYTDINDPPFPPKGKMAQWNGGEWAIVDAPMPIPPIPEKGENEDYKWTGKKWEKIVLPPFVMTELVKAKMYLESTAWLFIDGIIDLYPDAAAIKAARAAAIEVLKAHKAELNQYIPE